MRSAQVPSQIVYSFDGCRVVLLGIPRAEAQWVMAAHTVKNRVQQMTQKSENEAYDVAIVVLEAAPAAVYDKTFKSLQSHPDITITKNDARTGRIEIKGKQVAPENSNVTIFTTSKQETRAFVRRNV